MQRKSWIKTGIASSGSTSRLPITLLYSSQILSSASGVSNGDSGVKTLTGFDDFIKFISEGGHFSAETPGKPIFCSFAYLSDHSPYKVKFKIDIDSDPVYARIEYRNLKNDSYVGRSLQREKIIGDVHLAFYADRTAKIPTVAPRYISFNIVEHSRHYLK